MPVAKLQSKKSVFLTVSHIFLFVLLSLRTRRTLFCRGKKAKHILYICTCALKTVQMHAIKCYTHLEFESKNHGSRRTNTQKEASIIKASVGPGERRSLFQLLSCLTGITVYSSVAVTASYVLRIRSAWPC